jgi:hydrogenase-4 component F
MLTFGDMLGLWLLLPALGGLFCLVLPTARAVLNTVVAGVAGVAGLGLACAWAALARGPLFGAGQWLHLDALSAVHAAVMLAVFAISSLFARVYFLAGPPGHALTLIEARRFGALWFGSLAAMTLVLLSNNLGILWVGVETTTLVTAFLICLHKTPESLEATWKYLIVCSVGVAFAFMGILLFGAAASTAASASASFLHWTHLRTLASSLDPRLVKLAFVFLLVGYGAKAGLAPMHSWLPDAHSQAPAPVSALFSGFLLNAALYALMRFLPLVKAAAGPAWASGLLVIFGVISVLVAAVFILSQHDLKRLLAYCSVEHLGFMALGLGLGPAGAFAALWHMMNHSAAKALGFFCAGRLGQLDGTHDLRRLAGAGRAHPLWGYGLFAALLALIGLVPFALFWSEFFILRAAVDARRYVALGLVLFGAAAAFVGILGRALDLAWGRDARPARSGPVPKSGVLEHAVVLVPLAFLLLLGLWLPEPLAAALRAAAAVVEGAGP